MKFTIDIARGMTNCNYCPFAYFEDNSVKCAGFALQDLLGIDCTKYDLSTMEGKEVV